MSDELHPEELLARAAARPLAPDEAADLQAHLERCGACALQVSLRAPLDRALAPTDADYEIGARAVQRLLASDGPALRPVATLRRARGGARTAARAALVALMLVGTGVGAAALVYRVRASRSPGTNAPASQSAPRAAAAHRRHGGEARVAVTEPAVEPPPAVEDPLPPPALRPAAVDPSVQAPAIAPPPPSAAPVVAPPRPRRAIAPPPAVEAPAPVETLRPIAPPPAPAARVPASGAALLFQAAERARRAADAAGAERLYARLAAEFPGTREEVVGRALRGQVLADELGRPAQALAAFDAYLRVEPQGVLAEETRAARAETLGKLGRRLEEGAAWRELLASYPRSIYAARARERLAALNQAGD